MPAIIEIVALANGRPSGAEGAYIESFDCEEGLVLTRDLTRAKRFENKVNAMQFWKQECPQGKEGFNPSGVNRPLTAFTVSVYDLEASRK